MHDMDIREFYNKESEVFRDAVDLRFHGNNTTRQNCWRNGSEEYRNQDNDDIMSWGI